MAEIILMTEEQKFQLEIYKLVMNQNAAAHGDWHEQRAPRIWQPMG